MWSGLFISDPDFLPIPDPGVNMAPDPGSATLFKTLVFSYRAGAVLVRLLPVVVEEGGVPNVRLSVHQGLVDQLKHAVPLRGRVQ